MIYFDNAASTKVDGSLLDLFREVNEKYYFNANSIHTEGQKCSSLIDRARASILDTLHLNSDYQVIFTGSATEANNLAIKGYVLPRKKPNINVITTRGEHSSVYMVFKELQKEHGIDVRYVNIKEDGTLDLEELKKLIDKDTILVSAMAVNNETGAVNNLDEVKKIVKDYPKCVLHSDLVQAIGKIDINFKNLDMFTLTSHKIHGFKGVGALVIKKGLSLHAQLVGGHQENGYRASTSDTPNIVCFAKALKIVYSEKPKVYQNVRKIYDNIRNFVLEHDDLFELNSKSVENPFILNFSLKTKKASVVTEALSSRGIMVSSVSACSSKREPVSWVILAMGKDELYAKNTIRLSFSKDNTVEEAEIFKKELMDIIKEIK